MEATHQQQQTGLIWHPANINNERSWLYTSEVKTWPHHHRDSETMVQQYPIVHFCRSDRRMLPWKYNCTGFVNTIENFERSQRAGIFMNGHWIIGTPLGLFPERRPLFAKRNEFLGCNVQHIRNTRNTLNIINFSLKNRYTLMDLGPMIRKNASFYRIAWFRPARGQTPQNLSIQPIY